MVDRKDRIRAFIRYLGSAIFEYSEPVENLKVKDAPYSLTETVALDGKGWKTFCRNDRWGEPDKHYWFETTITGMPGKRMGVFLSTGDTDIWNTDNPQILLYVNGKLSATFDMNHQYALIAEDAGENDEFLLTFYAYSNNSDRSCLFNLDRVVVDEKVKDLYFDFINVYEAAVLLGEDDKERVKAFKVLEDAISAVDTRTHQALHDTAYAGSAVIWDYLADRPSSDVTVWSVGSTHIDVAWKWPVRQTREKAIRSALTAINLMDKYPDFTFLLTQPQVYQFIKEQTPDLFQRIRERIKEGRWEAEGAMWLEPDCNMTGGESLARQLIYGQKFFQDELGAGKSEVLWLPDAFGFPPALPTIMKDAGIRYFVSTKIGWNDTDKFPYDTFIWRGIDGSEVLSHFISTQDYGSASFNVTYNGLQNASQIAGTWKRFQDKDVSSDVLTCYGYGDGGGGPTPSMLENGKRLEKRPCSIPNVRNCTVREFFHSMEKNLDRKRLPVWAGELYLEYHRGVFTSIAEEKKWNKAVERCAHDAEFLSILSGIDYPESEIESIWKTLLLNQFHDILPGSAIDEVYETAFREYAEAKEKAGKIIESSLSKFQKTGRNVAVINTASHMIDAVMILDEHCPALPYAQKTYDGRYACLLPSLPPMGYKTYKGRHDALDNQEINDSLDSFETPFYRVSFSSEGFISSLYDKEAERELVEEGKAFNRLVAYEDRPLDYDNWNLEEYYAEKGYEWELEKAEIVESGPVRQVVKASWTYSDSRIEEEIIFYAHTRRIDFNTVIDWNDDHALVKAEFPTTIFADRAWFGTQFGAQSRSLHRNTSWDMARFEVQAQRFADISEPDYGIAILADAKYGYGVSDGVLTLSLLKSGTFPAFSADKGVHSFTYSVFPHHGDWRTGGVEIEAEAASSPLYLTKASDGESSFMKTDDNIFVSAVKRSEDGRSIIVRLYEGYGMRSKSTVVFDRRYRIFRTNILEESKELIAEDTDTIELLFRPYSLCTLSLEAIGR